MKHAVSMTLSVDNVLWLKGQAAASARGSVSDVVDRLVLEARTQRIAEGLRAAEEAKKDRAAAEKEYQERLAEARREGQALLDRIAKQGEDLRKQLETKARTQADGLIAKARAEIQQERDKAVQDLRAQVADLALLAAGRIIGESLDAKKHRELIERAIQETEIRA